MSPFAIPMRLRRRRVSRGQSLVEFALVLPLLLVFLAAVLDLGRIFYANISLLNAAREGAFQAAKTPDSYQAGQPCNTTTNLIVCRVQLESKDSLVQVATSDITVSCSAFGCPKAQGSTVTVGVSGSFTLITPLLGFLFGGQTIPIDATATTQIEYFPTGGVETLPPGPVAVISAIPTSGEAPLTVDFDGSASSGSPTAYEWDFGDGGTASGWTASHTFAAGTYDVTLRVINLAGDDTATTTITVAAPAATPTPTPTPLPGATPTPTPTPTPAPEACAYPPNVMKESPNDATNALSGAGWAYEIYGDLTTGTKNVIQAQNPDHTLCRLKSETIVVLHYRPNGGV